MSVVKFNLLIVVVTFMLCCIVEGCKSANVSKGLQDFCNIDPTLSCSKVWKNIAKVSYWYRRQTSVQKTDMCMHTICQLWTYCKIKLIPIKFLFMQKCYAIAGVILAVTLICLCATCICCCCCYWKQKAKAKTNSEFIERTEARVRQDRSERGELICQVL